MSKEIRLPAGYAPAFADGISDQSGNFMAVDETTRLPVIVQKKSPSASAALVAGCTRNSTAIGPITVAQELPIVVALTGTWSGEVRLLRSTDEGGTRLPLTVAGNPWAVFAGNVCEQAWVETEKGVKFYLDITVANGTVQYRVSQ